MAEASNQRAIEDTKKKAVLAMNEKAFLEELTLLTRKYRIEIAGCGCCGSPFLMGVLESKLNRTYVTKNTEDLEFKQQEQS